MTRGSRSWWQVMRDKWRGHSSPPEEAALKDIEREIQTEAVEEQTARLVAETASVLPYKTAEEELAAWKEMHDHSFRRRLLETQRDVLLRQRPSASVKA